MFDTLTNCLPRRQQILELQRVFSPRIRSFSSFSNSRDKNDRKDLIRIHPWQKTPNRSAINALSQQSGNRFP